MTNHKSAAVAAMTLLAMAAGCGGGGGEAERKPEPKPKAPLSSELAPWNRAVATQSCEAFVPLVLTANRHRQASPGGPAVADECVFYRQQLSRWRGIVLRESREFGPVGIAQGPGPRRGRYRTWTAIFVVDWDGRYRFFGTQPADPQIGTEPRGATDFQATADAFVKAIRERDCDTFIRYTLPTSSFYRGVRTQEEACRKVFGGRNLAPQLRDDPDARPEKLGETLDLGFFGLATTGNYYTLVLTTKPAAGVAPELRQALRDKPDALVLDYFPNYRPVE